MIQKFSIGAIAEKRLEMKHIYQFSYDDIYDQVAFMRKSLSIRYDFKLRHINPSGTKKFQDIDIYDMIHFCMDNLMDIHDREYHRESIVEYLEKETNFQTFLEKAAYVNLVVNRSCTPKAIFDRYRPSANSIKEEAQYVKIKSSILGIRYWINEDGALIINGPNGARQKYSKIKKEAFSWKICQSMVK